MRIMFRQTGDQLTNGVLSHDDRYFKLYYQFIKHGFGLMTAPRDEGAVYLRLYLDDLPDKKERCAVFKNFLYDMPRTKGFGDSPVIIRKSDIAEVRSHDHELLQCLDIVLGAMYFRLNNLQLAKPEGCERRGKRTRAKEKLYNVIREEIASIHPGFNIGVSTGARGYENPHWSSPYEHWKFVPKELQ